MDRSSVFEELKERAEKLISPCNYQHLSAYQRACITDYFASLSLPELQEIAFNLKPL